MDTIDDLRDRAEQAKVKLDYVFSFQEEFAVRVDALINSVGDDLQTRTSELGETEAKMAKLQAENEELRQILHTVLCAIEGGERTRLTDVLSGVEHKVAAMVSSDAPATEQVSEDILEPVAAADVGPVAENQPEAQADQPVTDRAPDITDDLDDLIFVTEDEAVEVAQGGENDGAIAATETGDPEPAAEIEMDTVILDDGAADADGQGGSDFDEIDQLLGGESDTAIAALSDDPAENLSVIEETLAKLTTDIDDAGQAELQSNAS